MGYITIPDFQEIIESLFIDREGKVTISMTISTTEELINFLKEEVVRSGNKESKNP